MISPNAAPIANVSPYKRIELGAKPKKPEPKWVPHVFNSPVDVDWLRPGFVAQSVDVFGDPVKPEEIYCG